MDDSKKCDVDGVCAPFSKTPRSCIYVTGGGTLRLRNCKVVSLPPEEQRGIRIDAHGSDIYINGKKVEDGRAAS